MPLKDKEDMASEVVAKSRIKKVVSTERAVYADGAQCKRHTAD